MKNLILLALTLASLAAHAQTPPKGEVLINEPEIGAIRVEVKELGEPSWAPSRMRIRVYCHDRRDTPNSQKPAWRDVIPPESVCDFRPHAYDPIDKILTIHASSSKFSLGDAACDDHWKQSFDLKALCRAWQPAQ